MLVLILVYQNCHALHVFNCIEAGRLMALIRIHGILRCDLWNLKKFYAKSESHSEFS